MKKSSIRTASVLLALILLGVSARTFASGTGESPVESEFGGAGKAKYVFLFIGDGMALPQLSATEIYTNAIANEDISIQRLRFSQFPAQGLATTYDAGTFITDSSSAATAIATGNKTLSGIVNMDPSRQREFTTIAELAKAKGMKVGIISSVSLDHATPACFYAKAPSRGDMYDICVQLAQSDFDFFGGGGLAQQKGKKGDQPDTLEIAQANGFTIVNDRSAFEALEPGVGKVIAINATLQDSSALPYEIDRSENDLALKDFTSKAVELLDNPDGFFLMVEGGKIDWACHANDAASSITDVMAFDNAVAEAIAFAEKHPAETLIVVTGDHETGGMTIGFAGTKYDTFFDKISLQQGSFVRFNSEVLGPYKESHTVETANVEDMIPTVRDYFGIDAADLTDLEKEQLRRAFARSIGGEIERAANEDTYLLYGGYEPFTVALTHLLNQRAGIGWTSYSHTGLPVPVFAKGVGQEAFDGYFDNTDIFRKLALLIGVGEELAVTVE